jgi:acyl-CoA dehydrogenase
MPHHKPPATTPRDRYSWPFLEPRHHEFADALDAWAHEHLPPLIDHADADATCRRLVAAFGDAGWLRHTVAAEGTSSLDARSLCVARDVLAWHDGLADFAFAMQGLGSGAISLCGSEMLRARYLPSVRDGKAIAAFALSEEAAGSDAASIACTATEDGRDHVRLTGEKMWISNGGIADLYVVFARTGEGPGAKGLSAFVVPGDAEGLSVAERLEVSAPHPLTRLRFEGVRVPLDHRIGDGGAGFRVAMTTLDVFRSTVGAAACGFARRALDETLRHVASRSMFGGTLADLQQTQATLADMATTLDAACLLVQRSAWTKDVLGQRVTRESAEAKMYATETAGAIVDRAVQLHGGRGLLVDATVERLTREVRALRIYEGATEVQKLVIARQLLRHAAESHAADA